MVIPSSVPVEKENAAIDMNISMAVEELSERLHVSQEELLPDFLESDTCAALYDRTTKLWWEGPTAIAELYLEEKERVNEKPGIDS